MKRLLVTLALIALLLPTAAAGRRGAPGDGTLTVKDGAAAVQIAANRGGVIGRFDQGVLLVKDPNPDDDIEEVVTGAEKTRELNALWTRYSGKNLRYRYFGSRFMIKIRATGIDFTATGKGVVTLQGFGTVNDGTYELNGGGAQPIQPLQLPFQLGATASP